jgi:hypothetical protein
MPAVSPIVLENITESLQSFLGVQQAQTASPPDITADAVARLLKRRADVSTLKKLWGSSEEWPNLVEDWQGDSDKAAVVALRKVLDRALVVQRFSNGSPKTFLPFSPLFISNERVNSLYREFGRSVVEGLWGLPELVPVKQSVTKRAAEWGNHHPLALLLAPLCQSTPIEQSKGPARLAEAVQSDPNLAGWVKETVAQDWRTWLKTSESLSVDEQVETMTALIGLHLHVALLWRLGASGVTRLPPAFFIDLVSDNALCKHAAYQCFVFWRERVRDALADVSAAAIQRLCADRPDFKQSLFANSWTSASLLGWGSVGIEARGKATKASSTFNEEVKRTLGEKAAAGTAPADGEVLQLLTDALVTAFTGPSSSTEKTKVYLRTTGQAAGIVGPREAPRKRYWLDEAGLSLLARLHVNRAPEEVKTIEEEHASVEAFIDDIGARYGIMITLEREQLRSQLEGLGEGGRPLRRHFPTEQAMSLNRRALERRLEALRLLRRYSDASAVIQIS